MATTLSIVSYLNTLPFVYGLELWNSKNADNPFILQKLNPAECANSLLKGSVDIGLVPIATFLENQKLSIISDYCIGTNETVDSVLLLSNDPIEEIDTIILDFQSKTSNNLIKILSQYFWKITPQYKTGEQGYEMRIPKKCAAVVIGDKAFVAQPRYTHCYDLGEVWKQMTGLPFVFACWVRQKDISGDIERSLNVALKQGIDAIPQVIENNRNQYTTLDLNDYLSNKISFILDEPKKTAMELYLAYAGSLK